MVISSRLKFGRKSPGPTRGRGVALLAQRATVARSGQPFLFAKAQHEVHVLHCLAGSTLHQIVDGGDHDHPTGPPVHGDTDVAEVGTSHMSRRRETPLGQLLTDSANRQYHH